MSAELDELAERFWAKVNKTETCWLWTAGQRSWGYGSFWDGVRKKRWSAHRFAYELLVGGIPDGLVLDHLCRTPLCVNPEHLEPVGIRENTLRGVGPSAIHATRTSCPAGHAYDAENTYEHKGKRYCRACQRKRDRERRRRRPAVTQREDLAS